MKNLLTQLNPAFDHRNRLGIMSILVVNDWVEYNTLKEMLNLTDGNLASHLKALEALDRIEARKHSVGRKPPTTYTVTVAGKSAVKAHLNALEAILKLGK